MGPLAINFIRSYFYTHTYIIKNALHRHVSEIRHAIWVRAKTITVIHYLVERYSNIKLHFLFVIFISQTRVKKNIRLILMCYVFYMEIKHASDPIIRSSELKLVIVTRFTIRYIM